MFGKTEDLVVILVIVLVLFGAKKLPELSKGIAESVKEVRKGFKDEPPSSRVASSSQASTKTKSESTTKV
jgi:sec-independent protein translocase protein TatA